MPKLKKKSHFFQNKCFSEVAPSANALQRLVNKFSVMMSKLCLSINVKKSVVMIFKCKRFKNVVVSPNITLDNKKITEVSEVRYLGSIFVNTLSNSMDIDRCCSAFLGQFYGKYRKFSFTNNFMILKFLFEACCTSFYGAELWYDMNTSDKQFKAFGVAYHKSIKRMTNLPPWESQSLAEEIS